MKIRIVKTNSNAVIPTRAHEGDLFDFYALEDTVVGGKPTIVRTGISAEIPKGYQMRLYNRSSNALKRGLILANSVGIIDTQYRGEICGIFCCYPPQEHVIKKGDRIMQGELVRLIDVEFTEADSLSETKRGKGGFGSTGK